jgi:hypothetical protein
MKQAPEIIPFFQKMLYQVVKAENTSFEDRLKLTGLTLNT